MEYDMRPFNRVRSGDHYMTDTLSDNAFSIMVSILDRMKISAALPPAPVVAT
jgi:hypothetical protein